MHILCKETDENNHTQHKRRFEGRERYKKKKIVLIKLQVAEEISLLVHRHICVM